MTYLFLTIILGWNGTSVTFGPYMTPESCLTIEAHLMANYAHSGLQAQSKGCVAGIKKGAV